MIGALGTARLIISGSWAPGASPTVAPPMVLGRTVSCLHSVGSSCGHRPFSVNAASARTQGGGGEGGLTLRTCEDIMRPWAVDMVEFHGQGEGIPHASNWETRYSWGPWPAGVSKRAMFTLSCSAGLANGGDSQSNEQSGIPPGQSTAGPIGGFFANPQFMPVR